MNASDTDREAVSSSGTGFNSATTDAIANSSTPTSAPVPMLPCTIESTAATTSGTEIATTAVVYRKSRGGYVGAAEEASSLTIPSGIGSQTTPLEPCGVNPTGRRPTQARRLG